MSASLSSVLKDGAGILVDAAALKQLAVDYLHPEDDDEKRRRKRARGSLWMLLHSSSLRWNILIQSFQSRLRMPLPALKTTEEGACGDPCGCCCTQAARAGLSSSRASSQDSGCHCLRSRRRKRVRAGILVDAAALKQLPVDYLQDSGLPAAVETPDATACGSRPFALRMTSLLLHLVRGNRL